MQEIKKLWKKVRIWEVLEKIVWWWTPSKSNVTYWNWDIYWCSVKDMWDWVYKLFSTQDKISELGLQNSATNLIPKWNIIISTRMWLWRWFINQVDMAINQDLKALFPNSNINKSFLFWSYICLWKEIESMWQWTTVKWIRLEDLRWLEILLPPLPTQQKIASILSKYDDLIENNNKRIKILEKTAQSIYEEWFVKYNFPWSENIKMIDSGNDDFVMIPEGWEVRSILDIDYFRFIRENLKEYEWEKVYYATADIDWICITWKWENFDFNSKPSRAQKEPILNSVWFARMIETFKVLWFTQTNEEIANRSILSSWMVWFEAEEFIFPFLYYTINSKDFHSIKNLYCTWATQRALTNDWLKQIKIIYPTKNIVENYWKLTKSMIDEMFLLQKQNQNLKETRDLLIPRLVSGELYVENLDVNI